MLQDFKKFLMRGNVIEIAVGLIMALAFGKIVTSLVNDVIMPPVGLLLGKIDFSNLYINLSGREFESLAAAKAAGAATINYGTFINTLIEFLIIGFVLFVVVRQLERVTRSAGPKESGRGDEEFKEVLKESLKEGTGKEAPSAGNPD